MKTRILVVDDNARNARLASLILGKSGYDVLVAYDAAEALECAITYSPEIILMDVRMPKIDGSEATRRLKANPETRDIPVVALTAQAMPSDKAPILAAGCEAYLSKPYQRQDLLDCIESLLGAVRK